MTDDIMTRVREWLASCVRVATENGVPEEADLEAAALAHIDGEPARLAAAMDRREEVVLTVCAERQAAAVAAAREEQREACARYVGAEFDLDIADASVRRTPLTATPLADEIAALRAEVVSLRAHQAAIEAVLEPSSNIETTLGGRVKALRARVAELEAGRDGYRKGCESLTEAVNVVVAERDAMRAQVAEHAAGVRYWTEQAQAEARDAAEARAQVEAAREALDEFTMRRDGSAATLVEGIQAMRARLDEYRIAWGNGEAERDAMRAQILAEKSNYDTLSAAYDHAKAEAKRSFDFYFAQNKLLRSQVEAARATCAEVMCSADCLPESCSDEQCTVARGVLRAMDEAKP